MMTGPPETHLEGGQLTTGCSGRRCAPPLNRSVERPLLRRPVASALGDLSLLREFTEGLRELGYVDGRNILIEPHYGDGTQNRLSDLAAGVVRSRMDIIVIGTNPVAAVAKPATATIPIVMGGAPCFDQIR